MLEVTWPITRWRAVFRLDLKGVPMSSEVEPRPSITPAPDGPLLVKELDNFTNRKGAIETKPTMALCRCGGSANKPFCDGTHAKIGFSSAKEADRTEDKWDSYEGSGVPRQSRPLRPCRPLLRRAAGGLPPEARAVDRRGRRRSRGSRGDCTNLPVGRPEGFGRGRRRSRGCASDSRFRQRAVRSDGRPSASRHRPDRRCIDRALYPLPLWRLEEQALLRRLALGPGVRGRQKLDRWPFDPVPAAGEVRIEMRVAGVNFIEP